MNIVKTKNFVIAVAVRLYKVVVGKMGVNGADKQVITVTITAMTITIITMTTTQCRNQVSWGPCTCTKQSIMKKSYCRR